MTPGYFAWKKGIVSVCVCVCVYTYRHTHTHTHTYIFYFECDNEHLNVNESINWLSVLLIFKYCTTDQCWFRQLKRGFKGSFVMIHFCSFMVKKYLEETRCLSVCCLVVGYFQEKRGDDSYWQGKDGNTRY